MFNRDDHDRKSCCFLEFLFDVANRVAKARRAIRKESLHSVARYNDNADIYLCPLQAISQMNNITNEPYIAYAVDETRQQDFQEYGRQLLLGINYKL